MSKPYHLLTPAERTKLRIEQNQKIAESAAATLKVQQRLKSQRAQKGVEGAVADLINCFIEGGDLETAKGLIDISKKHGMHFRVRVQR